jgi:hypothetical protein
MKKPFCAPANSSTTTMMDIQVGRWRERHGSLNAPVDHTNAPKITGRFSL